MRGNHKHGYTKVVDRHKGNPKWRAHVAWLHMKRRCDKPDMKDAKNYGDRGIVYDPRWAKFENFIADMGDPPEGHSLDRIDVSGNYCKENCRWATRKQQNSNKRRHIYIEKDGRRQMMWQWAAELGLSLGTIRTRHARGWPDAEILSLAKFDAWSHRKRGS